MAISKKQQNILLIAMILAVSMTTIDQTIVGLSANTIQSDLGVSHDVITWSINAYILATAAFFMLGGKLADVFGHKRMVMIGISGFALFSFLCGLTPVGDLAPAWLITMRILQGISTAIMFPAALGIVLSQFPKESRGQAVALFFAVSGGMTALGPILGGYLTEWTWRSIFWINIPIAIIAFLLVMRQKVAEQPKEKAIDWPGAALIAGSMALIIGGLQQASVWGWNSVYTWLCIGGGLLLFAMFVWVESKAKHPLLKVSRFKDRAFSISTLAVMFSAMAFIPIFFFLSVYAQISLGLDVNTSATLLFEFFIGFMIAAQLGGKVFDKSGARIPLVVGGAVAAVGFAWWATKLDILTNGGAFLSSPQFWPTVMAGAGIGFMFSAASTDIANRGSAEAYGESTGISQTAKNFGGALGLAILATVLSTHLTSNLTTSFTALGAPADEVSSIVQGISSGTNAGGQARDLESLPLKVQEEFQNAVKNDYADASKSVFFGMAAAMGVVFVLGLLYPRANTSTIVKLKAKK